MKAWGMDRGSQAGSHMLENRSGFRFHKLILLAADTSDLSKSIITISLLPIV